MPAVLLDVNAETYPYEFVQYLLDQTATFTFHASPAPGWHESAWLTPDHPEDFFGINGGYGLNLRCDLRRFDSVAQIDCQESSLAVRQSAGRRIGAFTCIVMFAPFDDDDLHWTRSIPPPAIYDRWRSQRFAMVNPEITFEGVGHFRGFGVGRTYPIVASGQPLLLAGAVANFDQGTGPFQGKDASVAFCGTFTRDLGFDGVITLRIPDPAGTFRFESEDEQVEAAGSQPDDTFVVMRGEKKDRSVRTVFGPKPSPTLDSLITPSQMRAVRYPCRLHGDGLRSGLTAGPVVARMNADVQFNLSAPPGTAERPGPFTTSEVYDFIDLAENAAGSVMAGVEQGISFGLQFPSAPGQPGVRFTGVGPVTGGTGPFAGAQGLLTVNSVIGIAPHALSLTHVLHLVDPAGRFRA